MKWTRTTAVSLGLVVAVAVGAAVLLKPKPSKPVVVKPPLIMDPVEKTRVAIYFSQNRGSDIITSPVYRDVPKAMQGDSQAILAFTTQALLKGPTPQEQAKGFFSEIPAKTELRSIVGNAKSFTVDLSTDFADGGGSNSMTQRLKQLAKTMASTPVKQPIFITVNGQSLTLLGGEGLSVTEPITQDPSVAQ